MNKQVDIHLTIYKKLIYLQDLCEQFQHAYCLHKEKAIQKISQEVTLFIQKEQMSISQLLESFPTFIVNQYINLINFLSRHPLTHVEVGDAFNTLNVWQRHLNYLIQIIALEIESDVSIN